MEISASFSPYATSPTGAARTGGMARGRADAQAGRELSPEQQQAVRQLQQIDQQVRRHEQAHLAAAAGIAVSGANFQFTQGPDGRQYAVAGEVRIDTSPGRDPEDTIDKAQRIRAAALAPSDPSPQDRAVAVSADQMRMEAQIELNRQRQAAAQANGTEQLPAYAADTSAPGAVLDLYA